VEEELERELEVEDEEEEPERVFVAADDFEESDVSDIEVIKSWTIYAYCDFEVEASISC